MEDTKIELLQEVIILKKEKKEVELIKKAMKDLCLIFDDVLQVRQPSLVYSMYLKEQFLKWQVSRIRMGIPYELETGAQFLQAYFEGTEREKYLVCEFYVHDFLLSGNTRFFPDAYIGDVQI